MNELVADTIEFLRTRKERLQGFNQITRPYWCSVPRNRDYSQGSWVGDNFGNHLKKHVEQLLVAFETGTLFDWLRGDDEPTQA
jgi:hypothetical protein